MTTNTRSEWLAVAEEFMAEEFERLGGPPTPEEVVAYAKGTLSEEEANRVRALLVYEPTLTDVLVGPEPMPSRNTWTMWLAAAALAVLVVGSLFTPLFESRGPEVSTVLHSIPTRGASADRVFSVPEDASQYRFRIVLIDPRSATYRVELFDADTQRLLWSTDAIERRTDDTIEVVVDGDVLERGAYVLRTRGRAGESESFNIAVVPKEAE